MKILCDRADDDFATALKTYLHTADSATRYAALACIAETDDPQVRALVDDELIEATLNDKSAGGESGRLHLARILGHRELNGRTFGYLERLLHDHSPAVVREAMASAGCLGDQRHVGWLIMMLGDRDFRPDARRGLAAYGVAVLGTLHDHLVDSQIPIVVRTNIPRVLRDIPNQDTIRVLTASLEQVEPRLRYHVIKALSFLRSRHQGLKFNAGEIKPALAEQARSYYEINQILHYQRERDKSPASLLLRRALMERLDQDLEQIFRFLGLVYPSADIYNAYQGIVSGKKDLRANAVEFLDGLLHADVKRFVLPLLDGDSFDTILRTGRQEFQLSRTDIDQSLLALLKGSDNWLRICALFAIAQQPTPAIRQQVQRALDDDDIRIRETAELVRSRIDG
jgi:HEAT repeat protein